MEKKTEQFIYCFIYIYIYIFSKLVQFIQSHVLIFFSKILHFLEFSSTKRKEVFAQYTS